MIAIVWALAAAVLYGTGAALQQHQAAAAPDQTAGKPSLLLLLIRRPWWLLGIVGELGGFATHAIALRSGPLTVVQMLLASSLVFSVGTVHLRSGRRPSTATWAAVVAVVAGIGTFVSLTSPSLDHSQTQPQHVALAALVLGAIAVPVAAAGLLSRGRRRALLLAAGAGLADTCIAVVTMAFTHSLGHGLGGLLTSWPTYALVIGGPISLLLTQTAYQAGCPMISLPVITVVTPMASLAVGVGLLGETTHLGALSAAGVGLAVLAAGAGLITLSRTALVQPATADQPVPSCWPARPASGDPVTGARRQPAMVGHMRTVSRQLVAMARPAFGSLAFWTFPAWRTSPYWERIPYGESGPSPVHAQAGPPAR
ncbi:MAG TPA: DMT family transporter [Streptosporangiaceae bacterium]|jgi:drug/metabolite transporter (DMT)-like permease